MTRLIECRVIRLEQWFDGGVGRLRTVRTCTDSALYVRVQTPHCSDVYRLRTVHACTDSALYGRVQTPHCTDVYSALYGRVQTAHCTDVYRLRTVRTCTIINAEEIETYAIMIKSQCIKASFVCDCNTRQV